MSHVISFIQSGNYRNHDRDWMGFLNLETLFYIILVYSHTVYSKKFLSGNCIPAYFYHFIQETHRFVKKNKAQFHHTKLSWKKVYLTFRSNFSFLFSIHFIVYGTQHRITKSHKKSFWWANCMYSMMQSDRNRSRIDTFSETTTYKPVVIYGCR